MASAQKANFEHKKKKSNAHIQYEDKNKKDKNLAPNKFKF